MNTKLKYTFVFIFLVFSVILHGQKKIKSKVKAEAIEQKTSKVSEGYTKENKPLEAEGYMELAKEYESSQEYQKAENYYTRAKDIFTELKDEKNLAIALRGIAKMQEMQNKLIDAKSNYQNSQDISDVNSDKVLYEVNELDKKRLESKSKEEEKSLLDRKVGILNSVSNTNKEELADSYIQLSNTNIQQRQYPEAVKNLNFALQNTGYNPEKNFEIKQKISDVYVASNDIDKALDYNNSLLKDPEVTSNPGNVIEVKGKIGDLYFKTKKDNLAFKELESAYDLAMSSGKTFAAQELVLKLDSLYTSVKAFDKSKALQKKFILALDELVVKDSSLMSNDIIKLNEEKIEKLENERTLNNALITKQRNFILFSILVALILGVLSYLIYRSLKAIKVKNKKIALQSLRKDMNPHFIFNSLNSVNQFIAINDERAANSYLTKFSTLMRTVLNQSGQDFVTLKDELALLSNYLELEKQRFKDKFDYEIEVDDDIDTEYIIIPNMMLQPHLENAIWHGLRYKEDKGSLSFKIKKENDNIIAEIEDDGIGIEKSKAYKTMHQKASQSKGRKNIEERLAILNDLYALDMKITTINKPNDGGTKVIFTFPHNLKLQNEEA